jgi:hypothetical protein
MLTLTDLAGPAFDAKRTSQPDDVVSLIVRVHCLRNFKPKAAARPIWLSGSGSALADCRAPRPARAPPVVRHLVVPSD